MKNNRKLSAFSLIELSIVILIIGILIAGVTQSSRIIGAARINTAKTLTQSSPVASIKDLIFWIESTSDVSFDDIEEEEALPINTWYDINPQSLEKINLTQTMDNAFRPVYSERIINNLPAIKFDGTDDGMMNSALDPIQNQSTIFVVIRTPETVGPQAIFAKGNGANNINMQVNINSGANGLQYCDSLIADSTQNCYEGGTTLSASTNYVISMVYRSNTASSGIKFYQNGGSALDTAATTNNAPATVAGTDLTIGIGVMSAAPAYFAGHIGEIIIFSRALKDEERTAIQNYLGKKWGITIS